VKRLVIMGGNEAYNDWTSTGAEFNFYCDPDAAEEVIRKVLCIVCMFVQHACAKQVNVQAAKLGPACLYHEVHVLCCSSLL